MAYYLHRRLVVRKIVVEATEEILMFLGGDRVISQHVHSLNSLGEGDDRCCQKE